MLMYYDIMKLTASNISVCEKPFSENSTGPLDELFNLGSAGALPYRTLDMQFETFDQDRSEACCWHR